MLNPPISNLGVKGLRRTSKEILKWPGLFSDKELRMNLFSIYIFVEIGGTGGGCFRYMYSRFLKEAASLISNNALKKASMMIFESGKLFTELALLFKDAETSKNLEMNIKTASDKYIEIADIEEKAFQYLSRNIAKVAK